MTFHPLDAISPVDGRYNSKTKVLQKYFSESALIKYRLRIEIEYFIALCGLQEITKLKDFPVNKFKDLRNLYIDFHDGIASRIKEIESITNHDVKAVEYFLKEEFEKLDIDAYKEFIHFGLTSQDINNTAIPLSIKEAYFEVINPSMHKLKKQIGLMVHKWKDVPMLARTHGQAASPTRLGKEFLVFWTRLESQLHNLLCHTGEPSSMENMLDGIGTQYETDKIRAEITTNYFSAKFGGATGNFNAHHVAFPNVDWERFANEFIEKNLKLRRQEVTTQIEHYDNLSALMDCMKRINNILIDLSRDIWAYISLDYFKQSIKKEEVGSSAMPHKVNPIDFENAEGNLGIANSIFEFLSSKLPISRLQRDLTDSTVLRNIGVPFSHSLIAFTSLEKGLNKLILNKEKIEEDLNQNWAICAEAIQTILRREAYPNPYETLKELTRTSSVIDEASISRFIDTLDVKEEVKEEIRKITPFNYTGKRIRFEKESI